jgi:hypothetical protein
MTETKYRQVFEQFLNDYWGAFHEVLEEQSVNPQWLAASLFDGVVAAHARFAARKAFASPAVARLSHLWEVVAARREETKDAPLSAREIAFAREQFEQIYDALAARGTLFSRAAASVMAQAPHGHPRAALRADAAR